jgi:hypothetical protein
MNDETVATCPVCGSWFDDHGYQLVVQDLGSFDSIECVDKALLRQARERRKKLGSAAFDATTEPDGPRRGSVQKDSQV